MTFTRLTNLTGQVAVVTGAGGGMGREICKRLASLGATVYGIVRKDTADLQEVLTQYGIGHKVIVADITDTARLNEVASKFTTCDILVNCAGKSKIVPHKNLSGLTDEDFDTLLTVNLRAVFSTIRAFEPLLQKSLNGLIINISSASSIRTGGSNIAYAAAKAGLDSMTRNLSLALAPNIRVVGINPSNVETGFLPIPKEHQDKIAAMTPLKRNTTVEDVADVVEAVSTVMRFTTGKSFIIDGGKLS